jgi:hypothetical protein
MKTTRQRAEERRQEKLAAVQEQIDAGTLTIRRITYNAWALWLIATEVALLVGHRGPSRRSA